MGIKDLFEKPQQILTSADAEKTTEGKVESIDNLDAVLRQKEEFVPYIDFVSASNFAIYGSAEKYYEDAIKAIYREYPYDGSAHEKKEFDLNINYLTRYILKNRYPRTNGYITLATNATYNGLTGSYGTVSSNEYIKIVGGPHTASSLQFGVEGMQGKPLYKTFKYSNKLAENPYTKAGLLKGQKVGTQLSNLRFDPTTGQTVEFWLKKDSFDSSKTKREVVFDLWNNQAMGATPHATAGRFLIELTSSDGGPFRLTYRSGSTTLASDLAICSTNITGAKVATGGWNHYAVSVKSYPSSNETLVKFYVNGDLDKQTTISGYINEVTGALTAHIGALQTGTNLGGALGAGLLQGSLDEFRYWKEARTSEQIGRNWWTQVHGGSNKDTSNTTLGVYYKFNEGIVQTSAGDEVGYLHDKKILDYSGRVSNGVWEGYPGYGYNARSTNSAIVESNAAATEFKDPILYTTHAKVKSLQEELQASGSIWDDQNNASMLNAIPTFMREEDEAIGDGTLSNTLQIMGTYFDKIHHLVEALPKVRAASYLTASAKPYPFATHLLESLGLNAPEMFVQANILESIAQRDEDREYTQDITELKNLIYQNIYNNLSYIYKSKGTEKAIRNAIRCFGVDEELIRLNLYASNLTYELKDNIRTKTVKTKSVNFNDVDKFDSTVYLGLRAGHHPENGAGRDYITGSGPTTVTASLGHEDLLGMTMETEIIFPIKKDIREQGWFETPFTTVSLFGMHTPTENGEEFDTKDYANFQVQAIKTGKRSNHAYFKLTSGHDPYPIPTLTSSVYNDVYDNQRWNFSVRIKPLDPVTNFVEDNQVDSTFNPLARICQNYEVHFYGVNMETGYPEHTFHVSGTMEAHKARDFLRSSKKLYAGAHRQDFNGTTLQYTDVRVSNVKYWAMCLENEDLNIHASDPESYGITDPYKNISLQVPTLNKYHIPKIKTLALNWTFDNCTGPSSDAGDPTTDDSFFIVDDFSSGSFAFGDTYSPYGWLTPVIDVMHPGIGDKFLPPESGDRNPIDVVYLSAARRQLPEVISTADAVQILRQDDDKFTREHSIVQHYYAIEKSMYQSISEEMINMFASIVDFNNLIGEPVNRYRLEYKDLSKLRQLFFQRIGNTPNLDKYVEFYKWIDSAITQVIRNLVPASAEVSEDMFNMVESHVLERNKYWTKFPTIEFKQDDPEAGLRGIQELVYDWEHGHHPIDSNQSTNALYWKERAERIGAGNMPLENDSAEKVNDNKEEIRKTLNTHREAKKNSLAKLDGTLYGGREYSLRKFTKPYKLEMDIPLEVKSGINFERNKNVDIAKNALQPSAPLTISSSAPINSDRPGLPTSVIFVDGASINSFKDVDDDLALNRGKRKYTGTSILGRAQEFEQNKNETYSVSTIAKTLPATIVSSSVVNGYNKVFAGVDSPGFVTGAHITNIHHDFYGQDREIPMQGPFAEKYIGGHQSRHIRINPGTDDFQNRPEAWRILVGKQSQEIDGCKAKDPGAFGFVSQDYPWPKVGREPRPARGYISVGQTTPSSGDTITLSDGDKTVVFQFTTGSPVSAERVPILITDTGTDSAAQTTRRDNITEAINGVPEFHVEAFTADAAPTIVYLVNMKYGAPGAKGNAVLGSKGNFVITLTGLNEEQIQVRGMGTSPIGFVTQAGHDLILLNYHNPKATRYREELIKRPVNIKNIRQTTASVDTVIAATRQHGPIGNYTHNYEIVQTAGRTANDLEFRKLGRQDHEGTPLSNGGNDVDAVSYRRRLLQRIAPLQPEAHAASRFHELDPNYWYKDHVVALSTAHRMPKDSRDSNKITERHTQKTTIVSRFSAPGGYESMSRGFLDPAHEEFSPYDVITFRNRAVRGDSQYVTTSGSVPENFKDTLYQDRTNGGGSATAPEGRFDTTFRVVDIHGEPWGLRSHLTRYTAPFGRDSVISHGPVTVHDSDHHAGAVDMLEDNERPGFHKVHRNRAIYYNFTTDVAINTPTITYGVDSLRGIKMSTANNNNAKCYRLVNQSFTGMGGTRKFCVALWLDYVDQTNSRAFWALGDKGLGSEHTGRTVAGNKPICFLWTTNSEVINFSIADPDNNAMKRKWYTSAHVLDEGVRNIILSYDGDDAENDPVIYIDGVAQSLTEDSSDPNYQIEQLQSAGGDSDFGIIVGGGPSAASNPSHRSMLNSTFLECAVWNRNITADEAAQIYAYGMMPNLASAQGGHPGINQGAIDTVSNLVSWWRMGDSAGDPQNNTDLRTSGSYDGVSAIRDVMGRNNIVPYFVANAMTDSQNRINEAEIDTSETIPAAAQSTRVIEDNYTYFRKYSHDNYWVQHHIPRNHANYSWITASVLTHHIPTGLPMASDALSYQISGALAYAVRKDDGLSYLAGIAQDETINTNYHRNPIDAGAHIDFVGLNTIIAEPVDTKTNTVGHPAGTAMFTEDSGGDTPQYVNRTVIQQPIGPALSGTAGWYRDMTGRILNGIIHHRQGTYGWPSWKQIRGAFHPVVRAQHKQNEFTFVLPNAEQIETSSSISGRRVIRPKYGKLNYFNRAIPVTTKFKPIEATLSVSTKILNSFGKNISKDIPVDINTTYGNELVFFNRESIDKKLDLSRTKADSYEEVKDMFTRGALETSISPVTAINKFVYKESIYPAHYSVYSGDIRIKKDYTQNFWRATHDERIAEQPKTIHGLTTYGRNPNFDNEATYAHFGNNSTGRPSMSIWPLDPPTGAMDNFPDSSYRAVFAHGEDHGNLVGMGEGELQNRWSWPIKHLGGHFTYGTGYPTSSIAGTGFTSTAGNSFQQERLNPEATACYYMPHFLHATSSITSPTGLPLVGSSGSINNQYPLEQLVNITESVEFEKGIGRDRGRNPAQKIPGIEITDTTGPVLYTRLEYATSNDPVEEATALMGYNISMQPLNKNSNWAGFVPIQGGYTDWQAPLLAGKMKEFNIAQDGVELTNQKTIQESRFVIERSAPWHDNYEQFYNDIRVKAKDYSVLPEFRMEDHIANYVTNKGGNFLHDQNTSFRMVGLPSGSLGNSAANSGEENFYKVYGTSDFLKHFDVLKNDIEEHFEPSSLTLQCNAIIKFNPYDGFYPAQRTLQMASQFSSSYGQHVNYSGAGLDYVYDDTQYSYHITASAGETAGVTTNLAFRNFLSPMYAPGIMFNTIKAGIACDWPVMTEGIKIYKTRAGKSDYWGLGFRSPEVDAELDEYFVSQYGQTSSGGGSPSTYKKVRQINEGKAILNQGIFKIREDLRKDAIRQSLIVQSASISGLADGFQVIHPHTTEHSSHVGGFYATKINVAELPGMKETTYTMQLMRDTETLAFNRISITASAGPAPNMGRWDKRIPFEAIVNPENYLKNIDLYDYIAHPSCSMDVTASWHGQGDNLYSLMANNFCAAVPDFFLQNSSMTTIASRPQDELNLYAVAGRVYGMRIKMYRSLNRERDYKYERSVPLRTKKYDVPQDPRDDIGLHETFTMYSRASAFGPPIFGRVHSIRDEKTGDKSYGDLDDPTSTTPTFNSTAEQVANALTGAYDSMAIGNIFADIGYANAMRGGTQLCSETVFHTSSYLASVSGTLDSIEGYYWSHTPPYYHGEAWCDVLFKPRQTKTYSLAEIVDQVEVVQYRVDPGFVNPTASSGLMNPQFIPNGYHSSSLYSAENINANAMQIDSSVNLLGIGKVRSYAYSNVGQTGRASVATRQRTIGDSPAWIIQPKFETPMLNFNSLTPAQGGTCPRPLTDDLINAPTYGQGQTPRGMWHQFGTLPQTNEGVWMEVGDIPTSWLNNSPIARQDEAYSPPDAEGSGSIQAYKRSFLGDMKKGMKSLATLVGMDTTPKKLGVMKETTTVHEAVVAVPFIEKNNQRFFFTIDPHMVDIALGEESYRLQDGSDSPGQSVEDQIRKMRKYVFPPKFDFLNNRELTPIAMYIFEFSMSFDRDDLSYMWQNLMPVKAKSFQMSTSTINHNLLINELMGYANKEDGQPLKDKIQWMVFKVKQRAPSNYYDKIIAKTPELDKLSDVSRSRQVQLGKNTDARYSYNWPYDCFSIIEMANLEATVEFASVPNNVPSILKVDSTGGRASKQGNYGVPLLPNQTPSGLIQSLGRFRGSSGESEGSVSATGPTGVVQGALGRAEGLSQLGLRGQLSDISPFDPGSGINSQGISRNLQQGLQSGLNDNLSGQRIDTERYGMFEGGNRNLGSQFRDGNIGQMSGRDILRQQGTGPIMPGADQLGGYQNQFNSSRNVFQLDTYDTDFANVGINENYGQSGISVRMNSAQSSIQQSANTYGQLNSGINSSANSAVNFNAGLQQLNTGTGFVAEQQLGTTAYNAYNTQAIEQVEPLQVQTLQTFQVRMIVQ